MINATKLFSVPKCRPAAMLMAALVLSPVASPAAEIYSGQAINLDLADADLGDVLASFSELTDLVCVVDSRTVAANGLDRVVSVTYDSVPWDRALAEILSEAGLEWTLEGKVLWIHLPDNPPTGDRNFTGDAINLRLEEAKVADVLETMEQVSGIGIEFDPDIDATVSVRLRSIPWDQALDLILRISGFDYAVDGGVIEVVKIGNAEGMQLMTSSTP